ncbi:MAG: ATP-binding protein [Candidatus Thorarchaeota archaeon]|jgi:hypothetical protein
MPNSLFHHKEKFKHVSVDIDNSFWSWLKIVWLMGTLTCLLYLILVYILPMLSILDLPLIPLKFAIELIICAVPITAGGLLTGWVLKNDDLLIYVENEFLILSLKNYVVASSCLELTSVSGSVGSDRNEGTKYNTAMLLALRVGIGRDTSMAFEVGVSNGEPYIRIYLTASGQRIPDVKEMLRREATRTEAILLSSLRSVELQRLEGDDLRKAATVLLDGGLMDIIDDEKTDDLALMILEGEPRVAPATDTSQIGTFLTAVLKQGYSASFTCVFSSAKAGKEKRRMESEWKDIRAKEIKMEDSLADQATKRRLLRSYEDIQSNAGWFETSTYLLVKAKDQLTLRSHVEGLEGLVHSIWGGDDSIAIERKRVSRRVTYKLFTRRHLQSKKIHVSRLAAFVNTPMQQLPVIMAKNPPEFSVPPKELVDNELFVGWTIFHDRPIGKVGLRTEWLREHVAVLGATGTGKTTLVKQLISELSMKSDTPWWIFDVKGSEYTDLMEMGDTILLRPGLDPSFTINLLDSEMDSEERHAHVTFSILRELLRERNAASELSPAMERLLREAVLDAVMNHDNDRSVDALINSVSNLSGNDRMSNMTKDALLNRLEILSREPLGSILGGGADALRISELLNKRVVFDLRYVARIGGMESVRLLYNIVAKRIFDSAMKRGITPDLHHVVVLEEASNLVPESYTRQSAAEVTTGESMVMLQRATGQGVIVVSTRPNISSNILANTSSKFAFRLPYDSPVGGRFMSVADDQEVYLRKLKVGRALVVLPNTETFEIMTKQFSGLDMKTDVMPKSIVNDVEGPDASADINDDGPSLDNEMKGPVELSDVQSVVFDKLGELASHILAFLASRRRTTEEDIRSLIMTLDPRISIDDVTELIRDLVSLSTIQREALSLVPGGFLYTLPGKGLGAVKEVIIDYIVQRLQAASDINQQNTLPDGPDFIFDDKALLVIPEHLKTSSIEVVLDRIRKHMSVLGNEVVELIVIVRGSVAAAKLRDLTNSSEEFHAVNIISAFPSSINKMIDAFTHRVPDSAIKQDRFSEHQDSSESVKLIGAVHDVGPATSREAQLQLWFELIQDFVDLSSGRLAWNELLEFIETTALQSLRGRAAPMNGEEGRRALTELLADEFLVAVRVGDDNNYWGIEEGLWVVNSTILKDLKNRTIEIFEKELRKHNEDVTRGHGYYDLCTGENSYVVFPNQQQLNTLLRLHSEIACRTCKSVRVICVLTAAEYLDDSVVTPANLAMKTIDDGMAAIVI